MLVMEPRGIDGLGGMGIVHHGGSLLRLGDQGLAAGRPAGTAGPLSW